MECLFGMERARNETGRGRVGEGTTIMAFVGKLLMNLGQFVSGVTRAGLADIGCPQCDLSDSTGK
jgi:hypothetical protein